MVAPSKVTLRTYQVGFGDCFLLAFHYPKRTAHVLIDFGSTKLPKNVSADHMTRIAKDIATQCRGKLNVVVATHRHRDHISGFSTNAKGNGPGDAIRKLKPDVVIQPWTEDPAAAKNAKEGTRGSATGGAKGITAFVTSLEAMHSLAETALVANVALRRQMELGTVSKSLVEQLQFIGEDNLKNLEAVKNLMTMGARGVRRCYVNAGTRLDLSTVLPGVKVHVLGPPTLVQSGAIKRQRSRDKDEFWHLLGATSPSPASRARGPGRPFQEAYVSHAQSTETLWFRRRISGVWGEQMLSMVRSLDRVTNNTSVILLFEVKGAFFLFPGDAQIENWQYALSQSKYRDLLRSVKTYKVGHHGSLNGTPKTLWSLFKQHRGNEDKRSRLKSVVSTLAGKHGSVGRHTEVPRKPLMQALDQETTLFTTQTLRGSVFHQDIELL